MTDRRTNTRHGFRYAPPKRLSDGRGPEFDHVTGNGVARRLRKSGAMPWPPSMWAFCCCTNWTHEKRDADSGFALLWDGDHGANLLRCVHNGSGKIYTGGVAAPSSSVSIRRSDADGMIEQDFTIGSSDSINGLGLGGGYVWSSRAWANSSTKILLCRSTSDGAVCDVTSAGTAVANDVAVDSAGNCYVIGPTTQEVRKYNTSGSMIWSTAYASEQVLALAVDASDNLYVGKLVAGLARVQKFSSAGTSQWNTSSYTGTISDIAVDSAGDIWWCHNGATNNLVKTISAGGSSSAVTASSTPKRVCCAGTNVYVLRLNSTYKTVSCHDSSGTLQWSGDLTNPATDIDCDGTFLWACGVRVA